MGLGLIQFFFNEMLQIVWKQKLKSDYGTKQKKILNCPPKKRCPLFDELKKSYTQYSWVNFPRDFPFDFLFNLGWVLS